MQTNERAFEHIMSAVLEQKQLWEKLQTENRELRQQLVDLRAGRGIFVEIHNQRFELVWESTKGGTGAAEAPQGKRAHGSKSNNKEVNQPSSAPSSGVLEEMLLDELSSAMKNRMGSSGEGKSSTSLNEDQKANLRRELSGSFLLE
jgi:hypothetical protein